MTPAAHNPRKRTADPTAGGVEVGVHRVARTVTPGTLAEHCQALFADGFRLGLVAAHDEGTTLRVVYLFLAGSPDRRIELQVTVPADDPALPSLASMSFPASRFEREMHDLFGIVPLNHPLPRRLVRHAHWPAGWYPMRHDAGPPPPFIDTEAFPFLAVEGDGVYEIPVGPVHAGIIEPAHFRFSVVGETILKLKARLWFTHRGVEKLFEGLEAASAEDPAALHLAERISGDTSAAHALAHSLAVEDALGIVMPEAAHRLRALILELERLYNHAGDLGALANDVGFSLANAHALRIREELLRINQATTGHRLLRGAIGPGVAEVLALPDVIQLARIAEDLAEITRLTLDNTVIRDRFTGTAVLTREQASDLGCLGYVARASGLATDARLAHPTSELPVTPLTKTSGDVLARFTLRMDEFAASTQLATHLIDTAGPLTFRGAPAQEPAASEPMSAEKEEVRDPEVPMRSGVGIVEGWRGTIVHRVEVDSRGHLTRVKIVDPSWFNWPALPIALAGTIVPDFPVTNKSFNLSYAGNDL